MWCRTPGVLQCREGWEVVRGPVPDMNVDRVFYATYVDRVFFVVRAIDRPRTCVDRVFYSRTLLIRKHLPLGPYSRPMPMVLRRSLGGVGFL